jgi:hypothetical protein
MPRAMTPKQVERGLDMLYDCGIFQVEFEGGGPLLLKDLPCCLGSVFLEFPKAYFVSDIARFSRRLGDN